jgi:hypothetical protein
VLVVAPPTATAAPGSPTVDTVTAAPKTLTVTRKETRAVTVSLHLVVPGGQDGAPVVVDPGKGVGLAPVTLTATSGDDTDGTWQGKLRAGSMMNGQHQLSVELCPSSRDCATDGPLRLSLGSAGLVTVNGSDWPVLTRVVQDPHRLGAGRTSGATASSRVVYSDSRDAARGVDLVLQRRAGATGSVVDRSNRKGVVTSPWPWPTPQGSARLALRLPSLDGVTFGRHGLGFPASKFAVSTTHSPAIASLDRRYTVKGFVSPGFPAKRLGQVVLEMRRADRWATVDRSRIRVVSSGGSPTHRARFTLSTRISSVGLHTLRVRKPAALCGQGPCRVAEGTGARFEVVTGNRTYFVERRLDQLDVPVGAVDGVDDARTRQALCAWRDMAGFTPSRNGLTKGLANSILRAHRLPNPKRSDGLYVNKTCQILFQVVHSNYRRVVWASSGQPGYETPNGTGAIFRKLKGPVESTLYPGAFMYHPMFFFPSRPAIALHGSASNDLVLPYPASHGCVRVWRPDIFKIWKESPLGTKVQVYGKY